MLVVLVVVVVVLGGGGSHFSKHCPKMVQWATNFASSARSNTEVIPVRITRFPPRIIQLLKGLILA